MAREQTTNFIFYKEKILLKDEKSPHINLGGHRVIDLELLRVLPPEVVLTARIKIWKDVPFLLILILIQILNTQSNTLQYMYLFSI